MPKKRKPTLPGVETGASHDARQEPLWAVVRAAANLPGLPRDHLATVNLNNPDIQKLIAHQRLVPLPAAHQPRLKTDKDGNPKLEQP